MAERKFAWGPRAENVLIGKEIPRIDGLEKCTGEAKYTSDINPKGTLYARLLICTHALAKITALDTTAAEKMPGVKSVYAFKKVGDECRWDGELVVAVAAERVEQADDAIKAITVKYEVLPHFVDEDNLEKGKAMGRTSPDGPSKSEKGEVDAELSKAAFTHTGKYGVVTISHMCLEPHGATCYWNGDTLEANVSTQNVSGIPGQYAQALGIDASNVHSQCAYEGGGFGSKFQVDEWGVAAAKMSKQAGRPVRLMLDRATELKAAGTRPSGFADVTVGADANGKLTVWKSHHWGTAGPDLKGGISAPAMPYVFDIPTKRSEYSPMSCNVGPNRAWRAPPHPQLCALTQTALDDLAAKMRMDPYDFFLKNLGLTQRGPVYAEEMKIADGLIGWKKNWHAAGAGAGGAKKRGLGMAMHTWRGGAGACQCDVIVNPDGSVATNVGSQDIGTGTRTIIAITLAETFGLPLSAVKVNLASSKYPPSAGSGGSITVGGVSGAHRRGAQTALWQIFDKVAEKYKVPVDNLAAKGGNILNGKEKVCSWKDACSLIGPMPLVVRGKGPEKDGLTTDTVGGVQMVDLTVDTGTGAIEIHKFVCVQDCGLILDELTAKSQVLGGMIMGIAYALSEERVMDSQTGRYINANLRDYKLPRAADCGELVAVMYQPDSEYERGVVGLGEPPVIAPGAAISNAVFNAIGVRVPTIPLTPKRVLDALKGAKKA